MVVQHRKDLVTARAPVLLALLVSESLGMTRDYVLEDDGRAVCRVAGLEGKLVADSLLAP